jgi:GNAT superfamily N-acetyltransferase
MKIIRCTPDHVELVAPLFDAYRIFYGQSSDFGGARIFLRERMEKNESVIFLAFMDSEAVGFTQLYPSFSSISMKRVWILNDLFVAENARKQGVAEALMHRAKTLAVDTRSKGIALETGAENFGAQQLYEKLFYAKNVESFHYFLSL